MRFVTLNPVAMSILGSTPWIHGFCRGLFIFAYPPDPNVKARDRQGRLLPGWMYICVDRRGGVSTWLVRIAHWLELRPATPITDAVGSAMLYSPPKWFRDYPVAGVASLLGSKGARSYFLKLSSKLGLIESCSL